MINVLDFGALGDGVHNDYEAFQKTLDKGGEIYIPQGIYNIGDTLKIHSNTKIIAEKTAKMVMKSASRRHRNDFLLTNADTESGNENISITGGIWDGNNQAPENAKPDLFDENGYSGTVLNFVNVKDLSLKDMVLANSVTYYIRMSRLHNFKIENIDFISDNFGVNQDGLHFGGDVKHGEVKNIRALSLGQTNDDMIALNADDSVERVENRDLARNSIEDITFENIFTESCHTIVRFLSITAPIKNIRIKNVYGGFRCYAINADAARYCKTPLFKEEDYPQGVGKIEDIYMENFICYPVMELPVGWKGTACKPSVAVLFESQMNNFNIRGFKMVNAEKSEVAVLKAKNLVNQNINADGKDYSFNKKEDVLILDNVTELKVSRN